MILSTNKIKNRKLIAITFGLIEELFKFSGTHIPVIKGIPEDARLIGVSIDESLEVVELLFEHPSFPKIPDGVDTIASYEYGGIDTLLIHPEDFCDDCRKNWRKRLDEFFSSENKELNSVWNK